METTTNCLIEQLLIKMQASLIAKGRKINLYLGLLKQSLSNLLENYSLEEAKTLKKDGALAVLELPETKDLLFCLGFKEETEQFVYCESDENLAKLERCLSVVLTLIERSKVKSEAAEESESSPSTSISPAMSPEHGSSRHGARSAGGSLKELFLAKHLKKEQLDGMAVLQKNSRRQSDKSCEFAFNNSGFFHQSCNNNASRNSTARKNRLLMKEIFHQQETYNARGWSSSGLNTKMA